MNDLALEFIDDDGDKLHARKMPNSGLVRLVVSDTGRARYYLSTDERRELAAFLLDGLDETEVTR